MQEVASAPKVVRFGVFEVDLGARELRKSGVKIRLQEQPMQVLALLLERPGQVVTREELKRRLWPGIVVDFDHSLNTSVKKLRDALGDSADAPRFIETLPRRGYRFICPVNGTSASAAPSSAAPLDGASAGAAARAGAPSRGEAADGRPVQPPSEAAGRALEPAPWRRRRAVTALVGAGIAVALLALGIGGVRARRAAEPGATLESIAVLPLKNLSGDPQQDYFADGMTEAVITELGKIGALRVLSYPSVAGYRGTAKPLSEIAREVKVDAFLVGAVVHSGGRVRVTASLVRASPERHLWAESYELDVRDVLGVQKELARDVAAQISAKVMPREQVRLAYARRVDPEAYEAYLLGRAHLAKAPTAAATARAREYFEKAIAKDPGYPAPYAGLAELLVRQRGASTRDASANRLEARRRVEKALELDDTLAWAHTILARIAQQEWDWPAAEREYRRAIELNPSDAKARIWYALFLDAMRRFEEAAAEARRAQQLDPASPLVNTWAGAAYFYAGRAEEAAASWRKALELDPGFSDASLVLARAHVTRAEYPQAIAELRRALEANDRQPLILGALAHAYALAGQRQEAEKLVAELRRLEEEAQGYVAPFGMIWAYAGLGERDAAFERLERAYRERIDRMAWLDIDPLLEPLRSDPRFDDLVRRVGLPAPGSPRAR
jgi:TolB-like protein/DNA-binding winged helix-turn-helix (wHTH) protein